MKSYGRAPTFLLATGYEQVRSVVAAIAGDHESAARVELEGSSRDRRLFDRRRLLRDPSQSSCCPSDPVGA